MTAKPSKSWSKRIAASVAVVFGIMTVFSGGLVLFGGSAVQAAAGDTVRFVVWFNFLSGFAYILAGVGIAAGQRWAKWMAIALAGAIAAAFAGFGLHVVQGGAFEMRTVGALTFRLGVWIVIAVITARNASRTGAEPHTDAPA